MKVTPGRQRLFLIAGSLLFTAAFFVTWGMAQTGHRIYLPLIARRDPPPVILITEVLYDPAGDEPAGEWVELYNPRSTDLDLSAYKIGDAESAGKAEGMYQFPPGTHLPPQTALVIADNAAVFYQVYGFWPDYEFTESDPFVPTMSKYLWWAGGNLNLSNAGDEVLLLDTDNRIADALSWGNSTVVFDPPAPASGDGISLERYPALQDSDSSADWRAQAFPNPGQVDPRYPTPTPRPTSTATPAVGRIYLSEALIHPLANEPAAEWIELYNPETYPVTLGGLKIGDEETRGGGEGMYVFPSGAQIAPGQALIVAVQGAVFSSTWGFAPDYELNDTLSGIPTLEKDSAWATGSLNLSNGGDEILLLDRDDTLLDALSWGNSAFAFNPAAPAPDAGESLERYPPAVDTDTAADWRLREIPDPGRVDLTPPTATPVPSETPTPTATPLPADHLLISEVLYDAAGAEPAGEWIELHNPTTATIALDGYKIGDEETPGGAEGMYAFPISATLAAGDFLLIANDGAVFSATWGFAPDYELNGSLPGVPDLNRYTAWSGGSIQLGNSGDEVLLLGPDDGVVDALSWGTSSVFLSPPAPDVPEGHSLERYPPWMDSDSASDWRDQSAPSPANGL